MSEIALLDEPQPVVVEENARIESLIGPRLTDCFQVDKLTVSGAFDFCHRTPWYVGIVTGGHGTLRTARGEQPLRRGDTFFVSHQIKRLGYEPADSAPLELHLVSRASGNR